MNNFVRNSPSGPLVPQGSQGPQGPQGASGPQGPQGPESITTYSIPNIGTVADPGALRASVGVSNQAYIVDGFNVPNDGGGGQFFWASSSVEADDGGTIIKPTAIVGAGRWKRIFNGALYVEWFGAYGDSTTGLDGHDDTVAVQAAINVGLAKGGTFIAFAAGRKYRIDGILSCANAQGLVLGTEGRGTFVGGAQLYLNATNVGAPLIDFFHSKFSGFRQISIQATNKAFTDLAGVIGSGAAGGDTNGFVFDQVICTGPHDSFTVIGATNTNPIEVTTSVNHGMSNGDYVAVNGCHGNTAMQNLGLQSTVTAPNKFTVPVAGNGIWTSGGIVTRTTLAAFVNLVGTNESQIYESYFQYMRHAIYGGPTGSANGIAISSNTFEVTLGSAIYNVGGGWSLTENIFEVYPALMSDVAGYGLTFSSNWCGDGVSGTRWVDLVNCFGFTCQGNFFANSATVAPIRANGGTGFLIAGNCFLTANIINFAGPSVTQGVHIGPNHFPGADSAAVTGAFVARLGIDTLTEIYLDLLKVGIGGIVCTGGLQVTGNCLLTSTDGMTISKPFTTKPIFGACAGAGINQQSVSFGDTPAQAMCYWPPQNDHGAAHAFYVYDPAIATYFQRVGHYLGPTSRRYYGSAMFGKGGTLQREMGLSNACPDSATTALLDAMGNAAFSLTNGYIFRVISDFVVTDVSATPSKRYGATITALAGCVGGVATILDQFTTAISDPDTSGITVSLTQSAGFLRFNIVNGSGLACRAFCFIRSTELVTN